MCIYSSIGKQGENNSFLQLQIKTGNENKKKNNFSQTVSNIPAVYLFNIALYIVSG